MGEFQAVISRSSPVTVLVCTMAVVAMLLQCAWAGPLTPAALVAGNHHRLVRRAAKLSLPSKLNCWTEQFKMKETVMLEVKEVKCDDHDQIGGQEEFGDEESIYLARPRRNVAQKKNIQADNSNHITKAEATSRPPASSKTASQTPAEDDQLDSRSTDQADCVEMVKMMPVEIERTVPLTTCEDGEIFIGIDLNEAT